MFASLAERLQNTFKKMKSKGRLTEADVNEALREVRLALLEADVNFKVVKDFVARIKERAVGQELHSSLNPAQHVIKIVHDELTALMGGTNSKINLAPKPPTIIMMVGLNGAGKTTTSAKLANLLRKQGRRPLLVAADVYRPAAIKQLQVLGEQLKIHVFTPEAGQDPVAIGLAAVEKAAAGGFDMVIIDTAGRQEVNEELMAELEAMNNALQPHEILLVVDAMTGQAAVNVAETFNRRLELDGVVLTKLDGDTRGGAALSVRAVTGKPIKFAGVGEKLDALEPFHPDRMAERILGMGDMLTLIEKAQENFDAEQMARMQKKIRSMEFTLDDFLEQISNVKKMGPLEQVLGMIPGLGGLKKLKDIQVDEKELVYVEAIIRSMTPEERRDPERVLNGSRKRRIARGSGTSVQEVNRLMKQFEQTKKMMKHLLDMEKSMKKGGKMPRLPFFS
ncbi:MAG TPA: signal recognition particle protein [Bacillota bacterium]|jgi:signal recognition particle subunit SRP54|nr:signal recognition particle protein [Peptococcaceae bacterium MAG4]NLW37764.1 signal recognition particle protein [Peptococcaceae bacterium]HPZ44280.1 signal recognition particle protein [Bacillota bacterium]HQD76552.1 signal recognition particle protein [Bacillota bacterium]HUM59560.1 signal recognition particle protein [Bacillota bacterium]